MWASAKGSPKNIYFNIRQTRESGPCFNRVSYYTDWFLPSTFHYHNSAQDGPFLSLIELCSVCPQPGAALPHVYLHLDCRHFHLLDDSYSSKLIYFLNTHTL